MFELVPQTPLDAYFTRLEKGSIRSAMVSTTDDMNDQEVQTEYEESNKFN